MYLSASYLSSPSPNTPPGDADGTVSSSHFSTTSSYSSVSGLRAAGTPHGVVEPEEDAPSAVGGLLKPASLVVPGRGALLVPRCEEGPKFDHLVNGTAQG